jgi:hypothetical protein
MFFNKITDLNHLKNKNNKYYPFSFCNCWEGMETNTQIADSNGMIIGNCLGWSNQLSMSEDGKILAAGGKAEIKIVCFNENQNRWLLDACITGTFVNGTFVKFSDAQTCPHSYKSKINKLGNVALYSTSSIFTTCNVYAFCRNVNTNTWDQMGQTLQNSGRKSFGHSLAMNCSGNIIAIGAPLYSNTRSLSQCFDINENITRPAWIPDFQGGGVFVYCYDQINNSWIEYGDYSGMLNSNVFEGVGFSNYLETLDNQLMGDSVTMNDYGDLIATSAPGYPKISFAGGSSVILNCLYRGIAGSGASSFRGKVNIYCYHPPSLYCDKGFWKIQNETDINFESNPKLTNIFNDGCLTVATSCCCVKMEVAFNKDGTKIAVGMPFADTTNALTAFTHPCLGYFVCSNGGFVTVWQKTNNASYACWEMVDNIIAPANSLNCSAPNTRWNGTSVGFTCDGDKLLIGGSANQGNGYGSTSFYCYKNDKWINSRDTIMPFAYFFGMSTVVNQDSSIMAVGRLDGVCVYCWNGPKFNSSPSIPSEINFANTWVAQGPCKIWNDIAVSSNGVIQTAVSNYDAQIYVSCNTGSTWTLRASGSGFSEIAMSSNGAIQLAISYSGIYVSCNTGSTWALRNTNICCLMHAAISSDGRRQTVGADFSGIYYSSNTGSAWTKASSASAQNTWRGTIAMSSDGSRQITSEINGVWLSTDFGVNWTRKFAGCKQWQTMSSDGKIMMSSDFYTPTICSTNSGENFNDINQGIMSYRGICSISMSCSGDRIIAVEKNRLWASCNTGQTWETKKLPVSSFSTVKISSNGCRQFGIWNSASGYIYMSS